MILRKYLVALLAIGAWLTLAGAASAAFPNYSGCKRELPEFEACINIQAVRGNLNIKGFNVPLGDSLEIRGTLQGEPGDEFIFVAPTGTNGLFARPVPVPGGLLGIDWIPGNEVLAITELAGSASDIDFDTQTLNVTIPIKVRLVNFLLGMNCHIGTNSNPVVLELTTGTTNPPPPNRPIRGSIGIPNIVPPNQLQFLNAVNVENAFSIPDSSSCGFGLGLINAIVDSRLGLPSAGGNNSIEVTNNIGLQFVE
jgi:hypothetical protein